MYNGQFNQDKWVDDYLEGKENGVFIDVGGCRPQKTNNTYFFEKERNWTGVIIEANPRLIPELKKERPRSMVINRAVWRCDMDEEIMFEVLDTHYSLSSVFRTSHEDQHARKRRADTFTRFGVKTITLSSIFESMGKSRVDYLSLDVEGSELEALRGIDFEKYRATCITLEHNLVPEIQAGCEDVLTSSGYRLLTDEERQVYMKDDDPLFWMEDWYVDTQL